MLLVGGKYGAGGMLFCKSIKRGFTSYETYLIYLFVAFSDSPHKEFYMCSVDVSWDIILRLGAPWEGKCGPKL